MFVPASSFWFSTVDPLDGESISHFLGRFRRVRGNSFSTPSGLGQALGLGAIPVRWERLYFNPPPSENEILLLADAALLDRERVREMFPPPGMIIQPKPIMLCATCYQEVPCHQISWQDKNHLGCDRHGLRLLSKCINCHKPFPIPSLWKEGQCPHCKLPFVKMARHQKTLILGLQGKEPLESSL